MSHRRDGGAPTLAERSARAVALSTDSVPEALGRHCWVVAPPLSPFRTPALLTEWRRAGDGAWEGRVVYAADLDGQLTLVDRWVSAARLEPLNSSP